MADATTGNDRIWFANAKPLLSFDSAHQKSARIGQKGNDCQPRALGSRVSKSMTFTQ